MKTLLIKEFEYDGLGFTVKSIDKPIKVEVLGVHVPVDPGLVCIRMPDGRLRDVPTVALKRCPKIDFGSMLSKEQVQARKACGMLFGNGVGGERKLIPLNKCK